MPAEVVVRLLTAVCSIADGQADLGRRRAALLAVLCEIVDADCGAWSWGRGWPDSGTVAPVAYIDFGLDEARRAMLMEAGLDAEADREFRARIRRQMGDATHATTIWQDIFAPEEWSARPFMGRLMDRGGWSTWLHGVRYSDRDTWSCFFLIRGAGKADFGPAEKAVVELVLEAVPWLRSTAEESLPPEALVGLTPRQRTVMLMLLDGLPRKSIARRLGIGEDTVGGHVKSVYARLGVGSSSELASLFLRGR